MFIYLDETADTQRRILIYMVDEVDGYTPETGIVTPTVEISKNGAAQAAGVGSWTEIGDGLYYYELDSGEVDTLGFLSVRVVKTGVSRDFNKEIQIVSPADTAEVIADAVWDELVADHITTGTVGQLMYLLDAAHINKMTWDEANSRFNLYDASDLLIGYLSPNLANGVYQRTARFSLL